MAQKLTYEKVLEMFAETDKRFKETDERLDKRFAETDRRLDKRFAETDERLKKTEELIKANAQEIGGISDSNGKFAEEQYINALKAKPCLGAEIFKQASPNVKLMKEKITEFGKKYYEKVAEIDVLLEDGDKIGIVEIKYRVRGKDVVELIDQKKESYLKIYPEDKKKPIYLAIGGGSFDKDALAYAKKYGVGILKLQSGAIFDKSGVLKNFGAPVPKKTLGKTAKKAPAKRTTKKK